MPAGTLQYFEAVEGLGSGRRNRDLAAQGGEVEAGNVRNVGPVGGAKVEILLEHQAGGRRQPGEGQATGGIVDGEERGER